MFPTREGEAATPRDCLFLLQGTENQTRAYWYHSLNGATLSKCVLVGLSTVEGQRIPSEFERLRDKKIGIVGLGSVGSKVAVSLARSGVRNFILIDDDCCQKTCAAMNWIGRLSGSTKLRG
jgi:hypothetical protein